MNGSKLFVSVIVAALLCAPGLALAQEEGKAPATPIHPIELYGCKFNEGQGWSQLQHVLERWNAWMDGHGQTSYFGFTLVPLYHSSELDFDVIWAGGWPDGATMAANLETWVTQGGEIQAEIARVVHCDMVTNFAVLDLTGPAPPAASGPVAFTNCTVAEGKQFPDAMAAVQAWIAYEKEQGIEASHYMLFPAYGESSDAKYSFKWVTTSSWAALGKGYDQYGTGGGWQKAGELFTGVLDCDSTRLYQSTRVRAMATPPTE